MKLKRSTIVLIIAAAGLGVAAYIANLYAPPSNTTQNASRGTQLFDWSESDVQSFSVTTPLRSLEFERSEDAWQMTVPEQTQANSASIAFLLNLLATESSDRSLDASVQDWETFGFHQPLAEIKLVLEDGATHQIRLGEYDFNRSFIYGIKDYPDNAPEGMDSLQVLLVTPSFEDAVSRPLEDWKATPEEDTATDDPEETSEETDPSSPEATPE